MKYSELVNLTNNNKIKEGTGKLFLIQNNLLMGWIYKQLSIIVVKYFYNGRSATQQIVQLMRKIKSYGK